MVLPNDGFMGFPVAVLFFGETGLLFMLAHNAAMNFFTFTYGLKLMRRNASDPDAKGTPRSAMKAFFRLVTNPNIIALAAGFILSLCGGNIPAAVDEYLVYLGNISTPMAMIFIGSTLTRCRFLDIIKEVRTIEASLMKLLWLPVITLAAVYFLPITPMMKCIIVLGCSFPTAATVTMLSEQENQDEETACKILFLSTVASAATVPGAIKLLNMIFM
jgi:predicted permease